MDTAKNVNSELEEHSLAEDCNFHPPLEANQIDSVRKNFALNRFSYSLFLFVPVEEFVG